MCTRDPTMLHFHSSRTHTHRTHTRIVISRRRHYNPSHVYYSLTERFSQRFATCHYPHIHNHTLVSKGRRNADRATLANELSILNFLFLFFLFISTFFFSISFVAFCCAFFKKLFIISLLFSPLSLSSSLYFCRVYFFLFFTFIT